MHPRRHPSFVPGPNADRPNTFYSTPPDTVAPTASHMTEIAPNHSLSGPPTDPTLREDQLMHLHESPYQDPSQGDHQHRERKVSDKQQHRPSFVLDEQRSTLLSNTYADFLASLRNSSFGCEWIFGWAVSQYSSNDDAARLDLGLSRGFRSVHMCARRGCLSLEEKTPLQSSSTLLLPVENRDSTVVGYFMEMATDNEKGAQLRTGKYVYFPSNRELLKVSKVRGPPTASAFSSVCINRTCIVGRGVFVQDYVMASFSWQDGVRTVPERYYVHARTLSVCKMVQRAEDSGLGGYDGVEDDVSLVGETPGSVRFVENSFYGLAPFGIYASTIVPARLGGFGSQSDSSGSPGFSIGNWAVPQHALVCNYIEMLHGGMEAEEITLLRSQFVTTYGHVGAQLPRQAAGSVNRLRLNQGVPSERAIHRYSRLEAADNANVNQSSIRSMELLSLSTDNHPYGQKGTASHETGTLKDAKTDGAAGNATSAVPFTARGQRLASNVLMDEERRRSQDTVKAPEAVSSLPAYIGTSLMLPIHRQLAVSGPQAFNPPVEGSMKRAPSSVVESLEAAVVGQQVSSSSVDQIRAASPVAAVNAPAVSVPVGTLSAAARGNDAKQLEGSPANPPTFKKTLPAPTKNEIVIRNRISAQRSNEKRRRKIEATKTELAFLRTTYLPQLEHMRGNLMSENENLRHKFMQKYQQREIESFF